MHSSIIKESKERGLCNSLALIDSLAVMLFDIHAINNAPSHPTVPTRQSRRALFARMITESLVAFMRVWD